MALPENHFSHKNMHATMEFVKSRDTHCVITAGLFLLGNFLSAVYMIALPLTIDRVERKWGEELGELGVGNLVTLWIARLRLQGLQTTAIFISAFAWIFFAIVLMKLTWVLSSRGKHSLGSTFTIGVLAVGGSLSEFISSLLYIGMCRAMTHIIETYELNSWVRLRGPGFANDTSQGQYDGVEPIDTDFGQEMTVPGAQSATLAPSESPIDALTPTGSPIASLGSGIPGDEAILNGGDRYLDAQNNIDLDEFDYQDQDYYVDGDTNNDSYDADGLGWKTLEMIRAVSIGLLRFVDTAEYLFISAILFMTFVAIYRSGRSLFSMSWAYFGLLLSALSMAQFLTDVLATDAPSPLYSISVALFFVNQVFLLPTWVLWLGQQLKALPMDVPTESDLPTESGTFVS